MKNVIMLCLSFFIFNGLFAHEEPPKTKKEKSEKELERLRIYNSGVKSITIYKVLYDSLGAAGSKEKVMFKSYNKQGNFVLLKTFDKDTLTMKVEYTYSPDGNLLTDTDYEPSGKMIERNEYVYDKQGILTSGRSFKEGDTLTGSFIIKRREDKRLLTFIKYAPDTTVKYRLLYFYPESFDISNYTQAQKFNPKDSLMMDVQRKLNVDGNPLEKIVVGADARLMCIFTYTYNKNAFPKEIIKLNPNGKIMWRDVYLFISEGLCEGIKSYDKDNKVNAEQIYEYEFYK